MVMPYIMQQQVPDIENAMHRVYAEHLDALKKRVLKLEGIVDVFVDTSFVSRCVDMCMSMGRDALLIYVAVRVLT